MTRLLRSLHIAAIAALVGCAGTTPPRLYTLNMERSGNVTPTINIDVERLRPADVLDRGGIVIRRGEHELDTYPLDTWASDLGELVAAKLRAEFGPSTPDRPTLTLIGSIDAFEFVPAGDAGGEVHAALALEGRKKGESRYSDPLIAQKYAVRLSVETSTPRDIVASLTDAVEQIAGNVASDASALTFTESATSPAREEHLHTLDMTSSGSATSSLNIDVMTLRRHEALARNNILIRSTPTTIEYYPNDRWAASVSTLISEKLESEFGAPVTDRETVQLSGSVLAFERVDSADGPVARVKLDLMMQRVANQGGAMPVFWKVYEQAVPAASTAPVDIATSLSNAVTQIAVAISADVARVPTPKEPAQAAPLRLYTLDMTPSGKVDCRHNVVFGRIAPHDSLTRADILIVREDTEVDHFENERWSASLSELVPEKLSAEFGPAKDDRRTIHATGMITGFEMLENAGTQETYAKLALEFRWEEGSPEAIRRIYAVRAPLEGSGAPSVVKALSRAMEDIAGRISADLNALEPPAPPKPIQDIEQSSTEN